MLGVMIASSGQEKAEEAGAASPRGRRHNVLGGGCSWLSSGSSLNSVLRRALQWSEWPLSGLGTSVTVTCVGQEGWMAEGAAPTCPILAKRSPVLARLGKASSVLHDQVQLPLLCPFPLVLRSLAVSLRFMGTLPPSFLLA